MIHYHGRVAEMGAERKYDLDWSATDPEMAKLILRQAELKLDAQLKVAIAADQRAMVTGGILAGFAASLIAASAAYWNGARDTDVLVFGLATAAALLAAAALCVRAARPVLFCLAGSEQLKWWDHRNSSCIAASIGGETENYQERIEINEAVLKGNAKRLSRGVNIALASPFIALATWTTYRLLVLLLKALLTLP